MKKETCPAEKVMRPLKWKAQCQLPLGHKGDHERWSETKKWVTKWGDDTNGTT